MGRLTDNDRKFGPITYGKASWNPIRIVLSSEGGEGDDDNHPDLIKTSLTVYMFGWVFRIYLGKLIKPVSYKVKANYWDEDTIKKLGRDWYYYRYSKDYGFSLSDSFLQIFFGLQNSHNQYTHVNSEGFLTYRNSDIKTNTYKPIKDKTWSMFLPWTDKRLTKFTLLDDKNEVFYEIEDNKGLKGRSFFDKSLEAKKNCPSVTFILKDYDDTEIKARTIIEETVYKTGEGYFKWLSWFMPNTYFRRLDIDFDKETGPEKGSWKGGTLGLSHDATNMNHVQAMVDFCTMEHRSKGGKYKMKYVSREVEA